MKTNIKVLTTEMNDIPDFLSESRISTTIWFSGCIHNCEGCQNQSLMKTEDGLELEYVKKQLEIRRSLCDWVVLCGGDPLFSPNRNTSRKIAKYAKTLGYKIFVYTGYEYPVPLVDCFDYVKYGKYEKDNKDEKYWLASANQYIMNNDNDKVYYYENGNIITNIKK